MRKSQSNKLGNLIFIALFGANNLIGCFHAFLLFGQLGNLLLKPFYRVIIAEVDVIVILDCLGFLPVISGFLRLVNTSHHCPV
ncbi:hypothetical protein IMSAGC008_01543 [Muribaculaceae bacterium]|nr:hypothetical protein IMSAGC008_01543 [Muribaculaceae bacterium]